MVDGKLNSYSPSNENMKLLCPQRERLQTGRDDRHTYDHPTMSQLIKDEIIRKKSQDKVNGRRTSPIKRKNTVIRVYKKGTNLQSVPAKSQSKEK